MVLEDIGYGTADGSTRTRYGCGNNRRRLVYQSTSNVPENHNHIGNRLRDSHFLRMELSFSGGGLLMAKVVIKKSKNRRNDFKSQIVTYLILSLGAGLIIGLAACLSFGFITGLAAGFGAALATILGCLIFVGLDWINERYKRTTKLKLWLKRNSFMICVGLGIVGVLIMMFGVVTLVTTYISNLEAWFMVCSGGGLSIISLSVGQFIR